jgi:flagellar basal body-associated protein FliL
MSDLSTENEEYIPVKKNTGLKIFLIFIMALILIPLGIYSYLMIDSVRNHANQARAQAEGQAAVNPDLFKLMKEKSWLESRLKMANTDSVGLAIDLEDQTIQLELKGVVVMKSKIRDYSISGFFKQMDGNVYFNMFGSPLTILSLESTIAKSRFKVVQAPKSAEEADAMTAKKDSVIKQDVYWMVKLDRDIELNIQGIDSIQDAQSKYKFGQDFRFKRKLKNILSSVKSMTDFKKPEYTPEILISIPESEATAILHALPEKALITIRI